MIRSVQPRSHAVRGIGVVLCVALSLSARVSEAQEVLIEGTLRCVEGAESEEYRLARYALVEP